MSTLESRTPSKNARIGKRKKQGLEVDLNAPPPDHGGSSAQAGRGNQPGNSTSPAAIDVEALDDDVVISSPRAFAEAINNSRRTQRTVVVDGTVVVDVESEERSSKFSANCCNKRRRSSRSHADRGLLINLERGNVQSLAQLPPPPPPPSEPTFSCPVCMGPLVEEMSTKCGHIFCKECIKGAIKAQTKCPTCRRKVTLKDIIRVFLPTTN